MHCPTFPCPPGLELKDPALDSLQEMSRMRLPHVWRLSCVPTWEDLKQFCVGGKDNEIMAWASLILSIDMILYIYILILHMNNICICITSNHHVIAFPCMSCSLQSSSSSWLSYVAAGRYRHLHDLHVLLLVVLVVLPILLVLLVLLRLRHPLQHSISSR